MHDLKTSNLNLLYHKMGRGKAWEVEENELLTRAWIAASEDRIAGADQNLRFSSSLDSSLNAFGSTYIVGCFGVGSVQRVRAQLILVE